MEFKSKSPVEVSTVSFQEAFAAIPLDLVAAETSLAAALKSIVADDIYDYSSRGAVISRTQDVEHEDAAKNSLWVKKCSIGFDNDYLTHHADWVEKDLRQWIRYVQTSIIEHVSRSNTQPVILDGAKVRLLKVSNKTYSLTVSISYTFKRPS